MGAPSTSLAEGVRELDPSTHLSLVRTRLSGERTLMSWIRTAFAMISFGFTIGKFLEYLGAQPGSLMRVGNGRTLPVLLILLGLISLIVGMWEFRQLVTRLDVVTGTKHKPTGLGVIASLVALLGILAFVALFVRTDWL